MSEKKRIEEGPPIWVESTMSREEWRTRYKSGLGSSTAPEPTLYDEKRYKGGKWREGTMKGLSTDEIKAFNRGIDNLRELLKTKKFQKRPDYGPENEARP